MFFDVKEVSSVELPYITSILDTWLEPHTNIYLAFTSYTKVGEKVLPHLI